MTPTEEISSLADEICYHVNNGREEKAVKLLEQFKADVTEKFTSLGTVYIQPANWNSFKAGGVPELSDCEEVDLSAL